MVVAHLLSADKKMGGAPVFRPYCAVWTMRCASIIACVVGSRRASRARKQQSASNALRRVVSRTLIEKVVYLIGIGLNSLDSPTY